MGLISLKCSQCGGVLSLDDSHEFGFCQYCGNKILIQQEINNFNIVNDMSRQLAGINELMEGHYLRGEFGNAVDCAEKILALNPGSSEAWLMKIRVPAAITFGLLSGFARNFADDSYSDMVNTIPLFFESVDSLRQSLNDSFSKYVIVSRYNKSETDLLCEIFKEVLGTNASSDVKITDVRCTGISVNEYGFTVVLNDSSIDIKCNRISECSDQTMGILIDYSSGERNLHLKGYNLGGHYIIESGQFYTNGVLKCGARFVAHCLSKGNFNEAGMLFDGEVITPLMSIKGQFTDEIYRTWAVNATIAMSNKGNVDYLTSARFGIGPDFIVIDRDFLLKMKTGEQMSISGYTTVNKHGGMTANASAIINNVTYDGAVSTYCDGSVFFSGKEKKLIKADKKEVKIASPVDFNTFPITVLRNEKDLELSIRGCLPSQNNSPRQRQNRQYGY